MQEQASVPIAVAGAVVPGAETATVFGRVTVVSAAAPETWSQKASIWKAEPDRFNVILLRDGEETPIRHRLKHDGTFYWSLMPGRYNLVEWEWQRFKTRQTLSGRIGATFEVRSDDESIYIGDLVILFHGRQYSSGVRNHFQAAIPAYREQHPISAEPRVALMDISELPDDHPGGISDICGSDWGVDCDKTYRGLRPINPEQQIDGFPIARSISPLITWEASERAGVTYDIVMHEAVRYGDPGQKRWIEGKIVHYAAGLPKPEFSLPEPFNPGRKYFWSVRVRDRDRVSTWSTMDYKQFGFFIVAAVWRSGFGNPFRIQAP
jgi:hypothetical protein